MFNEDLKKLALWLTPVWLRKPNFLILILAFTWPLRQLYNDFLKFVAAKLYRLSHNGQVCYLQAVLNDAFDVVLKRIWIGNFEGITRIFFWPEVDERDVDFSVDVFFWANADYADSGIDFTIHVPTDIVTTAPQMAYLRALTDEYKLAGKNYNIVRF